MNPFTNAIKKAKQDLQNGGNGQKIKKKRINKDYNKWDWVTEYYYTKHQVDEDLQLFFIDRFGKIPTKNKKDQYDNR